MGKPEVNGDNGDSPARGKAEILQEKPTSKEEEPGSIPSINLPAIESVRDTEERKRNALHEFHSVEVDFKDLVNNKYRTCELEDLWAQMGADSSDSPVSLKIFQSIVVRNYELLT